MEKAKRKRRWTYYQYDFSDVYGKEWETDPKAPEEQITMTALYNGQVLGIEKPEEYFRRNKSSLRKCRICHRTTISGDYIESDIYPVWSRHDMPRAVKSRESRQAQKNLNNKNARKKVVRLINANFGKGDLLITLTYADNYYPTEKQAKKDIDAYIKALRRARKKEGLEPLKYLYVIEYVPEGENTKKVRIHHHIIINRMDRDLAESKWKKGRAESKYAEPDKDFGLEGYASYITKSGRKGHHSWSASRNLKKPIVHETTTTLTKKKMYDLARSGDGIGKMFEEIYKGKFRYLDSKIYYSDYVAGFYIYAKMRKKEGVTIMEDYQDKKAVSEPASQRIKKPKCNIYIDTTWTGGLANGTGGFAAVNEAKTSSGALVTGEVYGAVVGTTKNRLYLKALIKTLSKYTMPCEIKVHCQSSYLYGGINSGNFGKQQQRGFGGVANADLIKELLDLMKDHDVEIVLAGKNPYTEYELRRLEKKIKFDEIPVETDEREE